MIRARPSHQPETGTESPGSRPAPVARQAGVAPAAAGLGHSLGRIPIQAAPAEAAPAAPVRPAVPAPAAPAAAAQPAGVIQLAPWWKKGLAGLGVVGGVAAAGVGLAALGGLGLALSPAAAIAATAVGGASALAGGAYLRSRSRPGADELDELRSRRQALSGAREGTREALLRNILDEGLGQLGTGAEISSQPTSDKGGGDSGRNARGGHTIRLDPAQKDPRIREANLLHELIHVSADRVYPANRYPESEFFNVETRVDPENEGFHPDFRRIKKKADDVYLLADKDPHLTREQKQHIQGRMTYMTRNPLRELDTVFSDLLYYGHVTGLSEDSPTHKAIVDTAREAYETRRRLRRG